MSETNVKWMLTCPNPSPLAFFRFAFSMHRARAFDTYNKVFESALKECEDKDMVLQSETDWEIWLIERKAIQVKRSITKTNMDKDTVEITTNNVDCNDEYSSEQDNKKGLDENSLIANEILEWLESNQEKLAEEENFEAMMPFNVIEKKVQRNVKHFVLSSQLDMFKKLSELRSKIPLKDKILNPAYYGIIDLTGQYIGLKAEFAACDWQELRDIFDAVVRWQSIQTPAHFANYFDQHCILPPKSKADLIKFHTTVEFLRTSYPIKNDMSENHAIHALYYPLINTILNDSDDDALVLEWDEAVSCSGSDAKNSDTSPENKAKIGHKVDFKITLENANYVLQIVHGEVSDELNKLIKTYSKLDGAEFLNFAVYGVQVIDFN
ncbi:hypothetical protein G9A89_009074 [Geosiphon pyriformis]|nr:hypothetical protein G9A89_009074 [Geosiphon pyriformis]